MTNKQQTTLAAGALAIGATLVARRLRVARRIDFRGRVVLITGGSRGLGLCIARQLGTNGARLAIAARNESELERAQQELRSRDVDATTFVCDIANRDHAERLVDQVFAQ